jgi:hypothetical protein
LQKQRNVKLGQDRNNKENDYSASNVKDIGKQTPDAIHTEETNGDHSFNDNFALLIKNNNLYLNEENLIQRKINF